MKINLLKSKIHRATVTETNLDYTGSISIDQSLMDATGIFAYEKVLVANVTNVGWTPLFPHSSAVITI